MNKLTKPLAVLLLVCSVLLVPTAQAGRLCDAKKTTPQMIERGLTLAEKTLASLNASGEKVVSLARAGQDLSRYGLRYLGIPVDRDQSFRRIVTDDSGLS